MGATSNAGGADRRTCLPSTAPADASAIATAVRSGQYAAAEVMEAARLRHQETHPDINAVIEWFDRPYTGSEEALRTGPLAGVPILAKDYGSAVAGQLVEMGSRLAAGNRAENTAEYMRRLLEAGAQIVGRSAVPEFIQHGTTESRVHGVTRNPHDLSLSAGGSSGGAAAAVAAGVVPVAHAGDCAGSIRIPAAACGLFGLKPSAGRIPWTGATAASDWGGIAVEFAVTRTVDDTALLLDVLADGDLLPVERRYSIAVSASHWGGSPLDADVVSATEEAAIRLEQLGHRVTVVDPPVDYELLMETWFAVFCRPIALDVEWLCRRLRREVNEETVEPATRAVLRRVDGLTDADLTRRGELRRRITRRLQNDLSGHDMILTPTLARPTIPLHKVGGDVEDIDEYVRLNDEIFCYNYLFNVTGWASMSIPVATSSAGTPLGVQLSAGPGSEARLIDLARRLTS
jgi:Asp-tRNA(Asn)/Glu-tRNA(Gln) amidotransferase A subunit family amidase